MLIDPGTLRGRAIWWPIPSCGHFIPSENSLQYRPAHHRSEFLFRIPSFRLCTLDNSLYWFHKVRGECLRRIVLWILRWPLRRHLTFDLSSGYRWIKRRAQIVCYIRKFLRQMINRLENQNLAKPFSEVKCTEKVYILRHPLDFVGRRWPHSRRESEQFERSQLCTMACRHHRRSHWHLLLPENAQMHIDEVIEMQGYAKWTDHRKEDNPRCGCGRKMQRHAFGKWREINWRCVVCCVISSYIGV